jgi:deazaflavin-dependent oxidoreductase (nitroreductase family)
MTLSTTLNQRLYKFMMTPRGGKVERFSVRWFNYSPMTRFFTRMKGLAYNHPLLLTTTGRKSGKQHTVVLPWVEIEGRAVIVGSRGGLPTDPAWALNLRQQPRALARIDRKQIPVNVRIAEGDERELCWAYLIARVPDFAAYQKRAQAHRILPVFILERTDGGRIVDYGRL